YWYAFKGAVGNGETSSSKVAEQVGRVRSIIEGETAQMRKISGGFTEIQGGNWGLSGGKHLWWKEGQVGDELTLAVQIGQSCKYEVILQMSTAADYGRFRILLDGKELSASEDFYAPQGVKLKRFDIGKLPLEKGEHLLSFIILDKNPQAKPGNMLGVDSIELNKID
ncbi:MAG: hypothetical protein J7K65_03500, partial [Planctomycetes bacterium]|nr:hypothetical protein [Planctomycetota bacterium]